MITIMIQLQIIQRIEKSEVELKKFDADTFDKL
jgi:hypothetical protein